MPERYQKLFDLAHRLYASQSPVLIEAGALLLELSSNNLLCQLQLRSLSEQPIKSIRVEVQPLDEQGQPLGKAVAHRYGDLDLKRDQVFGRERAIVLPGERAAGFSVRLSQVSLADGEVWTDEGLSWEELPRQLPPEQTAGGEKEARRLRRRLGASCRFAPVETEELWFCACGGVNLPAEKKCHLCGCRRSVLFGRNSESEDAWEGFDTHTPEEKPPVSRRKRGLLLGAAGLVLLVLLAVLALPRLKGDVKSDPAPASLSTPSDSRQAAYEEAQAMLENGELDRAEEVFRSLGDYEDSARYLEWELPYHRALLLQEMADYAPLEDASRLYEQAAEAFEALGDYEDCAELAQRCREELEKQQLTLLRADYADASALLESGFVAEARQAFLLLGDFEDSADRAREAVYSRAHALYLFAKDHDLRGVTAQLTLEPGEENLVALPRERLLALGEEALQELEACFGGDAVRFIPRSLTGAQSPALPDAVAELLLPLGDYRDSAALAAELPELTDQSDQFFVLCAAGELEAARDWLNAYDQPFEDREIWLWRIERFLPYCGSWEMFTGDPTLASQMVGGTEEHYQIRSRVLLLPDKAVLVLLLNEGDETGPELYAELNDERFMLHLGEVSFLAQANPGGSLNLVKIDQYGGGVEYVPA